MRAVAAAGIAPQRLLSRIAHPELVSFVMLARLSRFARQADVGGIDAVVDVGANIGQFAFMASRVWPQLPIFSFEPDPRLFTRLERTFSRFNIRGRCFPYAVAEARGERELFRYRPHTANSLLRRADALPEDDSCTVRALTLDSMLTEFAPAERLYLKIDVQGTELAVLQGATQLLHHAQYVQVEVSLESEYHAASSAGAVMLLLEQRGFRLYDSVDELRGGNGALHEIDWLFSRRGLRAQQA